MTSLSQPMRHDERPSRQMLAVAKAPIVYHALQQYYSQHTLDEDPGRDHALQFSFISNRHSSIQLISYTVMGHTKWTERFQEPWSAFSTRESLGQGPNMLCLLAPGVNRPHPGRLAQLVAHLHIHRAE